MKELLPLWIIAVVATFEFRKMAERDPKYAEEAYAFLNCANAIATLHSTWIRNVIKYS